MVIAIPDIGLKYPGFNPWFEIKGVNLGITIGCFLLRYLYNEEHCLSMMTYISSSYSPWN